MKKMILSLVIVFASVASVLAQAGGHTVPSDPRFMPTYNQALLLNEDRFADLDKIAIGDTVYFPARAGVGVEYWIADYPNYGIHDCIWNLTGKYLANQLPTVVDTTDKIAVTVPIEQPKKSFDWIGLVLVLILLAFMVSVFLWHRNRQKNSINANPVLPGGLSPNPATAKDQIQAIDRARQIIKVERGQLIGSSPAKITMSFSDKNREVNLINGDYAYRVTEHDGTVSYWRQHCGNLIHPVADGRFNLPLGWSFVPVVNENTVWSAPEPDEKSEDVKPKAEEQKLAVYLHHMQEMPLDGEEIAAIVAAAGEMTVTPKTISYRGLVIEFQSAPSKPEGDQK